MAAVPADRRRLRAMLVPPFLARELSPKGFLKWFAALLFLALAAQGALNVAVDPYGIFHAGLAPQYDINPRHTKLNRLLAEPGRYDALILGDCRGTVLDPEQAAELFGGRWFNLATHNSQTFEPRLFVEHLLGNGVKIRKVLLNLGAFNFNTNAQPVNPSEAEVRQFSRDRLDTRLPSYLPGGSSIWPFLFSWPATKRSAIALDKAVRGVPPTVNERADGMWIWPEAEGLHDNDPAASRIRILADAQEDLGKSLAAASRQPNISAPQGRFLYLDELRKFYETARRNNIEVIAFLPPVFALNGHFPWRDPLSSWKLRSLLDICGAIYDFSIYSSWTLDPGLYMTSENFTPALGRQMLRQIRTARHDGHCFVARRDASEAYIAFKREQEQVFQDSIRPRLENKRLTQWTDAELIGLTTLFSMPPGTAE